MDARDFGGATMIGARSRQEDAWAIRLLSSPQEHGTRLLALVADGMGGHPGGDQASRITCDSFVEACAAASGPPDERLREALDHANEQVRAAVEANPRLRSMGTTLVAALFGPGGCTWISVGDSFLFHYRSGSIRRLNALHTRGTELDEQARRGEISELAARMDYDRPMLTSVVMGRPLEKVAAGTLALEPGDLVLLATDGVETLEEEGIASVCGEDTGRGAAQIAETIIKRIKEAPADYQDNATVVVVRQPEG